MKWISLIIVFLCLLPYQGTAQPSYKVDIPKVGVNGYYSIDLPYTVRGMARPDLSDIRILDAQGVEVPWLLRENVDSKNNDIPLQSTRIATKGKKTEIELVLPYKYEVECLDFYISSPRYYQRNVELLPPLRDVSSSILSDKKGSPQSLALGGYGDTLRLSVVNYDDRPLGIDSVKVFVQMYSLIAELKKDEQYTLTLGDPKAKSPQYDLSFSSRLPDEIDHIVLSNSKTMLQQIPSAPTEEPSAWITFLKTYGIWIIIVVVIIQILYMVRKMIK